MSYRHQFGKDGYFGLGNEGPDVIRKTPPKRFKCSKCGESGVPISWVQLYDDGGRTKVAGRFCMTCYDAIGEPTPSTKDVK